MTKTINKIYFVPVWKSGRWSTNCSIRNKILSYVLQNYKGQPEGFYI